MVTNQISIDRLLKQISDEDHLMKMRENKIAAEEKLMAELFAMLDEAPAAKPKRVRKPKAKPVITEEHRAKMREQHKHNIINYDTAPEPKRQKN
jgi:hypothetical protein